MTGAFPTLELERDVAGRMLEFARVIHRLKRNPAWLAALEAELPPAARIRPDQPSLLMGYDFHRTDRGPRLIEINNNAGGLFSRGEWLPQPEWEAWEGSLTDRLLAMFPSRWRAIAIMDEAISGQRMYPEMAAYAALLERDGRRAWLLSPEEIAAEADGLYHRGARIDAIYNRHTDFYLESEGLAHIRAPRW